MKTIEISGGPGLVQLVSNTLLAGRKQPGVVTELPAVRIVQHEVQLDAGHIGRYTQLCGFSPAQGVPLIYPQMLTFPLVMTYLNSADCPWPAVGTVHLANRIEQLRSLHAGERVRVEMNTGALQAHAKGQVFNLQLAIWRDDELVWRATQSLLRLAVSSPAGEPFSSALNASAALSCQASFSARSNIGRRYGAVSGDRNPIHLSVLSARLLGFRRALAHGMWSKARALACVLPQHELEAACVAVEFKSPIFLPAEVCLWTHRQQGGAQFEVRDKQGQRIHLRGQLDY
jgi:hypothetical protein